MHGSPPGEAKAPPWGESGSPGPSSPLEAGSLSSRVLSAMPVLCLIRSPPPDRCTEGPCSVSRSTRTNTRETSTVGYVVNPKDEDRPLSRSETQKRRGEEALRAPLT